MDKGTRIIFTMFVILIAISVGVAYIRFMINQDYQIVNDVGQEASEE